MSKKHREHKVDKSEHIQQRDKIKEELEIREFKWTDKQKQLIDLILEKETSIVWVSGKAGTSKTLCAVYCALKLLNSKRCSDIVYVRSIIESASKSIGALPGEISEKVHPFIMPMEDKLDELLHKSQTQKLIQDKRVTGIPINFLRGASLNSKVIIADEIQNFQYNEILTLITRVGRFSKLILCGDVSQSDIGNKSGFKTFFDLFNDDESKQNGIHTFEFTIEDVMRSGVVKYILQKIDKKKLETSVESMFPTS